MAYTIEIKKSARKELSRLPHQQQRMVGQAIDRLAETPRPHGVEKLKGQAGPVHRIRVGDYRIVYEIHDRVLVVFVIKIGHRKDVYRQF